MCITKAIAYAFPTSNNAKHLGFEKEGCYHVEITHINIEGSGQCQTFMPHNAEGFLQPDDKDLIAIFNETEGDICPHFLKYGNAKALDAIVVPNKTAHYMKNDNQ